MNVSDAIAQRRSTRDFLPDAVAVDVVRDILDRALRAPSGGNLQPWNVYVLSGDAKDRLVEAVAARLATHPRGEGAEYDIYPPGLTEPYRTRRYRVGEMMYEKLGIAREDKAARLMHFARNYGFFGAPIGMIFTMDRQMGEGQWVDLGLFMENILLLAEERGLATCAQESWAVWAQTLRALLPIPDDHIVFCGLALGYANPDAPVNTLRSERAPLEDIVTFIDRIDV
jgi:nitroreductase